MEATTIQPKHGEYGDAVVIEKQNANTYLRVSSFFRWCGRCNAWVQPTGITSMIVASVGCPKCHAPWKE